MFSLLFGMGFAVMLTRAERADRPFLAPVPAAHPWRSRCSARCTSSSCGRATSCSPTRSRRPVLLVLLYGRWWKKVLLLCWALSRWRSSGWALGARGVSRVGGRLPAASTFIGVAGDLPAQREAGLQALDSRCLSFLLMIVGIFLPRRCGLGPALDPARCAWRIRGIPTTAFSSTMLIFACFLSARYRASGRARSAAPRRERLPDRLP